MIKLLTTVPHEVLAVLLGLALSLFVDHQRLPEREMKNCFSRGTYTDYDVLNEDELEPKPESISHVEASVVPFAALTAWRALKSTARIKEGQRMLVIGGGGVVGLSAIQLVVAIVCHVSTTCGSESINRTLSAGAELAIDYTAKDLEREAATLAYKYGMAIGLPMSTTIVLKKQLQYSYSHGIEYWWTYITAMRKV